MNLVMNTLTSIIKKLSKTGLVLSGVYILFALVFLYHAFTCHDDMFCGLTIIIPIFPWPFLLSTLGFSGGVLDSFFGFFLFAFVNIIIIYYIGTFVQFLYMKTRVNVTNQLT